MPENTPRIFISYSWDDEPHRQWVRSLAERLSSDGVEVHLDQWDIVPGDRLPAFMERAVRENDFVLCVCTPRYKQRSDDRQGGVGYEGDVMTAEAFSGLSAAKFIPIHRRGSWSEAAPSWLLGVLAMDLRAEGFDNAEYRRLLGAIFRARASRPPIGHKPPWVGDARPKGRYRLVAFDLDGTLLRGLDFSWRLIWAHLGFPDALRKEGMRRYLSGTITYPEWCDWCVTQFQGGGLTKGAFKDIAQGVTATRNLRSALGILRREGVVTAIVSGGVDTLLYEVIPDAGSLFDYIFINKLLFDESGALTGVVPTEYDYQGKPVAIERICAERGFEPREAVFVGEGHNDAFVVGRVGLVIAYPPNDQRVDQAAHVNIPEDDLLRIIPAVLQS